MEETRRQIEPIRYQLFYVAYCAGDEYAKTARKESCLVINTNLSQQRPPSNEIDDDSISNRVSSTAIQSVDHRRLNNYEDH